MEIANRCISLFSYGKFQQCADCLSNQVKGDNPYDSWVKRLNSITSQFMTKHLEDKVTTNVQKQFFDKIQVLILEIRSAPANTQILQIELSALYNACFITLYHNNHIFGEDRFSKRIAVSLVRVIGLQSWKHCSEYDSVTDLMMTAVEKTQDVSVLSPLVYLCCLWSGYKRMEDKKTSDVLEKCIKLPALKELELPPLILLPLPLLLTGQEYMESPSIHDIVSLTAGMAVDDQQKARAYLEAVESEGLKPYGAYLMAFQEYKGDNYIEVLTRLSSLPHNSETTCRMKALCCHLFGLALSKLGKHQCAIQKYQESLNHDFSFLLPLYNISTEYRYLGMTAPELESLNLLATALEEKEDTISPTQDMFTDFTREITEELSRHQVLYLLTSRCSQLQMYEDASQRYTDLLFSMTGSDKLEVSLNILVYKQLLYEIKQGSRSVSVPSLQTIYMEAIRNLHLAKNYNECVNMCNQLMSCLPSQSHNSSLTSHNASVSVFSQTGNEMCSGDGLYSIDSSKRKRLRSDHSVVDVADKTDDDLMINLYKADCLVFLEKIEDAVLCLEICSNRIPLAMEAPSSDKQHAKRQRVHSDNEVTPLTFEPVSDLQSLSSTVYCHLGVSMALRGQTKDGMHFFRLGLRLNPGNQECLYNYCVLLLESKRKEAVLTWCRGRQIDTVTDSFHLSSVLRQKQNKLRSLIGKDYFQEKDVTVTNELSEELMLKLDCTCLNFLLSGNK